MKMQQECSRCHTRFWTTKVKVYILKTRNCPDCKEPCKVTDNKIFTCPKCGKIIEKGKSNDYGLMPIQMRGTIRNHEYVTKLLTKDNTIEVEIVFVPENQFCQSCRNFFSHRNALLKKKTKNEIREIPKEQSAIEIKRLIMQRHMQELQEKMKEEKEKKRKEILKKLEEKKLEDRKR